MASNSNIDPVCPNCGTVMRYGQNVCPDCGYSFASASVPNRWPKRDRASAAMPFAEGLKPLFKVVLILAVLAAILGGAYYGIQRIWKNVQEQNPYPTDPQITAIEFFEGLQAGSEQDYQECYNLLGPQRKAAVAIGRQSRGEGYFPHFARIRQYLISQSGADFADTMVLNESGRELYFAGDVVLHLRYDISKGLDEKSHYALRDIEEFPIDAAPGIGLEAHNRQVNRAIGGLGSAGNGLDDAAEIVRRQDYETNRERLDRLIDGFNGARSLDTKHTVLEWILREFPTEQQTQRFLTEVSQDKNISPNLRNLAQDSLAYYFPQ